MGVHRRYRDEERGESVTVLVQERQHADDGVTVATICLDLDVDYILDT